MLTTERLVLRPWCETDAPALYGYARDERVGPVAGWPPHASEAASLEVIRTQFARPEVYAVTISPQDTAVGLAGLLIGQDSNFEIAANEAEVAYWIGVPFWGQGLIPEAVRALMRHAFERLGMQALYCGHFDGNAQSLRVQEKCGFRPWRTAESQFNAHMNDYRKEHISRITRAQWLALSSEVAGGKPARG
ncbi:acetyltransferase [Bordetella trematum]|uniref:GNAT family N-acetyltransferase n=1 Tax=Bordetella trematum TaxID=123899 RepID=UPI0007926147|nr:GNAT family protein [Bordetella trematum]SAI57296.1 acetyltransferase [Bordetella trematum]